MRLTAWNCRMGLHRPDKWNALRDLAPDVAIIPEAATPDHPGLGKHLGTTRSRAWVGPNEKKGLAVVTFGDHVLEPLPRGADERPDALATRVSGPGGSFLLVAVWSRAPKYIEHLHDVLDAYEPLFRTNDVVMAGDFNSNAIWDELHGGKCHTRLVERLAALGLESAYHWSRKEPHGSETEKTLAWTGRGKKHYHIDYVFLPRTWLPRLRSCHVGPAESWLQLSDHVPVTVHVEAPPAPRSR